MEERLTFPETIKQAMERTIFWYDKDGPVWLYGLAHGDRTVGGYEGTWGEVLAINSEFVTRDDPRRLVPIQAAPPLAPSQKMQR